MNQKHSISLPPIRVLDGVMGVGKTQATKKMINNLWSKAMGLQLEKGWTEHFPRVLFVTPFVEETLKIVDDCPNLNFQLPDKEPMGSKAAHIEYLIKRGENIATTHVLFSRLSGETCQALKDHNYMLVIDEAVESYQLALIRTHEPIHACRLR